MSTEWAALSNRLLLLQEMVIGLSKLEVERVIQQVERGVSWVFDGATLHVVEAERLETPPLTSRGRAVLDEFGEVYLGYFAGPPRPLYLALGGVKLADPQEFRLAALFFEHFLAALEAAGYRGELERQARTDWLTRLDNRHVFERELSRVGSGSALGVLELDNLQVPGERRSSAENDLALKAFGEALKEALPKAGRAFRVGGATFAVILPEGERAALAAALRDHAHSAGWAAADEAQGGELFERADSRMLERKREKFGSAPRPAERVRVETLARSLVQVHSGFEQMKLVFQETALTWDVTRARPPDFRRSLWVRTGPLFRRPAPRLDSHRQPLARLRARPHQPQARGFGRRTDGRESAF